MRSAGIQDEAVARLSRSGTPRVSISRHNKGPVTRRGLLLPNLHIKLFSQRKEVPLYCFLNPEQIIGSTAALRFFPSLRSSAAGCDLLLLTGYRAAGHPFWLTEVLPLPHYAKNLFPPYGSPAVCRSLTVFLQHRFFSYILRSRNPPGFGRLPCITFGNSI